MFVRSPRISVKVSTMQPLRSPNLIPNSQAEGEISLPSIISIVNTTSILLHETQHPKVYKQSGKSLTRIIIILITMMAFIHEQVRRVCNIEERGFSEAFQEPNKRIQSSSIAVPDRSFLKGSHPNCVRALLGTSATLVPRARV